MGLIAVTVGGDAAGKGNWALGGWAGLVPAGGLTVTSTVVRFEPCGGVVAWIKPSSTGKKLNWGRAVVPTVTLFAPVSPLPLMKMLVPPVDGPLFGLTTCAVG